MNGLNTTHCEFQVDSNIWHWEATPSTRLTFENHANRLHIAKISSYIWRKFGLLCWDAFSLIPRMHVACGSHIEMFYPEPEGWVQYFGFQVGQMLILWHSASFGRGYKIWINPCIQKHRKKNPAEINHLIGTEAVGKTNAILCLQGAPQAMIKKIMDL